MPTTPAAQYSLIIRLEIDHKPGMLGRVASAIGEAGGVIGSVDLIIPSVFNRDVAPAVADAVAREAKASGAAQAEEHTIRFAAIDAERMRSAS